MKLTQTRTGEIIITRRTRNGAQERIGSFNTILSLKEAKAHYHKELEEIERLYNSQPNARAELKAAVERIKSRDQL